MSHYKFVLYSYRRPPERPPPPPREPPPKLPLLRDELPLLNPPPLNPPPLRELLDELLDHEEPTLPELPLDHELLLRDEPELVVTRALPIVHVPREWLRLLLTAPREPLLTVGRAFPVRAHPEPPVVLRPPYEWL